MQTAGDALQGFKGTRADVLRELKRAQVLTTKELGEALQLTPNALRRHLKELENDGLVESQREVRGVGQPVFLYSLTEAGHALFPQQYEGALIEALELIKTQLGSEGVIEVFRKRWQQVTEEAKPMLDSLPVAQRATKLAELLSQLGYVAETGSDGAVVLREHHCSIKAIVARFPEVCLAEEQFIARVLNADVVRTQHMAKGNTCCEYCITASALREQNNHITTKAQSSEAPESNAAVLTEIT